MASRYEKLPSSMHPQVLEQVNERIKILEDAKKTALDHIEGTLQKLQVEIDQAYEDKNFLIEYNKNEV